jgi:hypothetical protein
MRRQKKGEVGTQDNRTADGAQSRQAASRWPGPYPTDPIGWLVRAKRCGEKDIRFVLNEDSLISQAAPLPYAVSLFRRLSWVRVLA